MIRSIAALLGILTAVAVLSVSAVYLTPVNLPSSAGLMEGDPGEVAAGSCCTRCCFEIRINADDTYTMIESDCDSGRICRVATGVLRPKR